MGQMLCVHHNNVNKKMEKTYFGKLYTECIPVN